MSVTTYATLAELKVYLGITDTAADAMLTDSLETASRSVDHICGRKFAADSVVSARVFTPRDWTVVIVNDFYTTTGLIVQVDTGDDATFATTLTAADYELQPFNGINDGESGWPYYRINYVTSRFPCNNQWGWAAVPGPVKQATVYMAEETFKMRGSPFGVASMDQFGPIRMRNSPKVMQMLAPYQDSVVMMA